MSVHILCRGCAKEITQERIEQVAQDLKVSKRDVMDIAAQILLRTSNPMPDAGRVPSAEEGAAVVRFGLLLVTDFHETRPLCEDCSRKAAFKGLLGDN